MHRGYVPVWAAVFVTVVLAAGALALWLGHQRRDYFFILVPAAPVAWSWWSAIMGLRERRNAKGPWT
jgi:hypothetical protein